MTAAEIGRRGYSTFAKRIADLNQGDIASAMGLSDTTVSELKTKHMERAIALLAHCGLKVVDVKARCMPEATYQFLTATHERVMARQPSLIWEEDK